jgi:LPXTG-site transpeptidase (sortase) family protein
VIRVPRWAWAVAAVVLVVGGGTGVGAAVAAGRQDHVAGGASAGSAATGSAPAPGASSSASAPLGNDAAPGLQDPAKAKAASSATPVSVQIPSIAVNAKLESLHRDSTGALAPPTAWDDAGWFADGVVPGQVGPAVIAGHVDSLTSAAVFYDLDELAPGDTAQVTMSDGTKLTFTVTKTEQASKHAFPTSEVYAATPDPELRLITCGGPYDPAWGHYSENLIVFAVLTSS